jgi:Tfp pilus assembly protein PilX
MDRRSRPRRPRLHPEQGSALIAVLLAMTVVLALGGGLLLVTAGEATIAAHYRDGLDALHAADALVERLRAELREAKDVGALLAGPSMSSLTDGPSEGERSIHGETINLTQLTNVELCGRVASCSPAAIRAVTAERPRGPDNPFWRLYAHGWMNQAIGAADGPAIYLIAWLGDDPAETDGDPRRDGSGAGRGRVALRVRAYGPHGARREIDAVVADVPQRPRLISWAER